MSIIENPSFSQSAQASQFIHQNKISTGLVNNELLKNIEILDSENSQLKAALTELQEDLKDKENSIEESHKIITKLKDEYSKLIKEFQNLEQINNDLMQENEFNKKAAEGSIKANELISKLKKQTNDLINETNLLKKENLSMKSKIISNSNNNNKKEQDLKDKELIISDLKEKADSWVTMIKDREQIINEQSKKIKELNDIILRKDDQLKLMVNFSKEINKENKSNVAELTKQAVKTIKVLYNTLNNNAKNVIDSGYRVEFKNTNTTFQDFEPMLKNKKTSFLLEDALQGMMYIPLDLKSISKEFLMDMNFKTELIKSELYSSLIRENHIINFLSEIFAKLNIKDSENIKNISAKVIQLTNNFDSLMKENNKLKALNKALIQDKQNSDLFLKKFKDNVKNTMNKLREKYSYLTSNIDNKVQNIKNSNIIIKEKARKDGDKLRGEILLLRKENDKLKYDLEELKKLLDIQKDNEKLYKALEGKDDLNSFNLNNNSNNNNRNSGSDRGLSWNTVIQSVPVNSFNYIGPNTIPKINSNIGFSDINKTFNTNHKDDLDNHNSNLNHNNNKNINQSYHKKKKEIFNLKEQIGRVKDEINNLMLNSNNPDYNISDNFLAPQRETNIDTNGNLNNDIINKNNINNNALMKKIEDLKAELNKEKNKNIGLEKEVASLKQYLENLNNDLVQQQYNNPQQINKNIFTPKFFIKMFYTNKTMLKSINITKKSNRDKASIMAISIYFLRAKERYT